MHVGIIGGGLMGTALAYFLAQDGQQVTVLEQDSELGGLNGEFRFDDGLPVARYQHAIMPQDQHVRNLCAALGLRDELVFREVLAGFVQDGQIYSMTHLRDFLTFPLLTLRNRIQFGSTVLQVCRESDWRRLDAIPVKSWLIELGGLETFDRVWRPLLEAKFDGVYDHISAAYIWAWLNRMVNIRRIPRFQNRAGYLLGGHYALIQALAKAFKARGGRIETGVRVREIELQDGRFHRLRTQTGVIEFDALVAAVAIPVFAHLLPGAPATYLDQLAKTKYLGLICPVMVLDKPLSPYWTLTLSDPNSPFTTIIETPHPRRPDYHVIHLPRYTAPDNDWLGVPDEDIREAWLGHLKTIFPGFRTEQIRYFAVSRSRYVEPVYGLRMLENPIAIATPYQGLYIANTRQVYPALPTSEATIVHAEHVAQVVRQGMAAQVPV